MGLTDEENFPAPEVSATVSSMTPASPTASAPESPRAEDGAVAPRDGAGVAPALPLVMIGKPGSPLHALTDLSQVLSGGEIVTDGVMELAELVSLAQSANQTTIEFRINPINVAALAIALDRPAWYIALCEDCGADLAVPFRDPDARDAWAVGHGAVTDPFTKHPHAVLLTTEFAGELVGPHGAVRLHLGREGWYFRCTDAEHARDNGPYPSGQLALSSFRDHVAKANA